MQVHLIIRPHRLDSLRLWTPHHRTYLRPRLHTSLLLCPFCRRPLLPSRKPHARHSLGRLPRTL